MYRIANTNIEAYIQLYGNLKKAVQETGIDLERMRTE